MNATCGVSEPDVQGRRLIWRSGRSYRCLTRRGAVKLAAAMRATSQPKVLVMVTWEDPELQRESGLPKGPTTDGHLHVEIDGRIHSDDHRWFRRGLAWRPWFTVQEWWYATATEEEL